MKTAASAPARKEPARKRAGALADKDAAAANERRRPYGTATAATRALGLIFPKRPCGKPGPSRMAAKQRRECEPVAVRVAAVGAATLGL